MSAVVIASGTDRSGTDANSHTSPHIGSAISAAMIDAGAMDAADASTASIRKGIS